MGRCLLTRINSFIPVEHRDAPCAPIFSSGETEAQTSTGSTSPKELRLKSHTTRVWTEMSNVRTWALFTPPLWKEDSFHIHVIPLTDWQVLSRVWLFTSPRTVACQAPLSVGFFPSKSIGVGCHFLLQGIFLTQGSSLDLLHLLHSKWILYH